MYNSRRKGTEITIEDVGGEYLKSKEAEKLLGVTISSNLDWKTHVDSLCKTLKQRIGLLRRIKYKVNKEQTADYCRSNIYQQNQIWYSSVQFSKTGRR